MDDKAIVELYWQRSDRAIEESAAKYGGYCRSIAYNILKDPDDSEECVNDTYMSAWCSMPQNRPERLSSYLAKICRNHALSRLDARRRQKRGGGELPLALEELSECLPDRQDVQRRVEEKELMLAVNLFLERLPETERKVFLCRYFFMAAVEDIAKRFGFSRSKTASMLHRTRLKLQRFLHEEGLC